MSDHKLESACNYWDNQATNLIRPCQQEIPNYIFFTIPLGSAVAKHFKFSLIFVASLVSWKLKKIAMQTSQKNCTASFWLYSYYNIASEASNVYILSGQKFIKNAKNGQFWRVFENLKLTVKQCYQTGHF